MDEACEPFKHSCSTIVATRPLSEIELPPEGSIFATHLTAAGAFLSDLRGVLTWVSVSHCNDIARLEDDPLVGPYL